MRNFIITYICIQSFFILINLIALCFNNWPKKQTYGGTVFSIIFVLPFLIWACCLIF